MQFMTLLSLLLLVSYKPKKERSTSLQFRSHTSCRSMLDVKTRCTIGFVKSDPGMSANGSHFFINTFGCDGFIFIFKIRIWYEGMVWCQRIRLVTWDGYLHPRHQHYHRRRSSATFRPVQIQHRKSFSSSGYYSDVWLWPCLRKIRCPSPIWKNNAGDTAAGPKQGSTPGDARNIYNPSNMTRINVRNCAGCWFCTQSQRSSSFAESGGTPCRERMQSAWINRYMVLFQQIFVLMLALSLSRREIDFYGEL